MLRRGVATCFQLSESVLAATSIAYERGFSTVAGTSGSASEPRPYEYFQEKKNRVPEPMAFAVKHLAHKQAPPPPKHEQQPMPEKGEPIDTEASIPEGVSVELHRATTQQGKVGWLKVSGPLGSCNFSLAGTAVRLEDGKVKLWGVEKGRVIPLINKIKGAFDGVRQGHVRGLQLVGIGYKVEQKGPSTLELRIGKSHPVTVVLPPEVRPIVVGVDKIYITGVNKEAVGLAAAMIKRLHKVNVYTGKGVRDITEGAPEFKKKEFRKAGK